MELLAQWVPREHWPMVGGVVALVVVVLIVVRLRGRSGGAGDAKATLRTAQKAEKAGNHLEAARAYRVAGEQERAFDHFVRAEEFQDAAALALELGKRDVAASLYERAGKFGKAAVLLEEIRQHEAAAKLYGRAKQFDKAGDMFQRIGDFERAAQCYAKDGDFRAAAELCVKRKDYPAAAKFYKQVTEKIVAELNSDDISDKRRRFLEKAAGDAGTVFEKVRDIDAAFELYQAAGLVDDAARLGAKAGRAEQGAEVLLAAGKIEEAIKFLRETGETTRADFLQAEQLESAGDLLGAAELYANVGEAAMAAELYATMGRPAEAAAVMERAGKFGDAGQYYLKAKNGRQAAACFERAGMFERAAALYQRLGDGEKAVSMLIEAGDQYEAGLALAKTGDFAQALQVLQAVGPDDEAYTRTLVLRADIHLKQEELDAARPLYETGLGDMEVSAHNLQSFYRYGVLLQNLSDPEAAMDVYKRILKFDKEYRDVRQRYKALSGNDASVSRVKTETAGKRRYVILDELGRGGMGVVYKAMDRTLDRVVALKVLPGEMRENKSVVQNFFREAKAAAGLNHPNIVTVFDAGEEDDMYYIAMEYIEGRTLKQIVRENGPFALPHWMLVLGQVCKALDYAHKQKIVHRDIKPSNLMWLERDKVVKITDFGLAKIIQEVANFQTVIGGTPHYMSPEQILGEEIDQRADIYSLGASMYELATGSVPYPKGDAGYHHIHSDVPDPQALRPDLPDAVAALIRKCMAKEPEGRYRNAAELLDALQTVRAANG